ncbi:MAG: hypothetical protein MI674_01400 [Cytophagales bacterium]|nr:hypothetical protein [Cytophagales bacterium]
MKNVKLFITLAVIAVCGVLSSCAEENEIFPQDEFLERNTGEGAEVGENGPPD